MQQFYYFEEIDYGEQVDFWEGFDTAAEAVKNFWQRFRQSELASELLAIKKTPMPQTRDIGVHSAIFSTQKAEPQFFKYFTAASVL